MKLNWGTGILVFYVLFMAVSIWFISFAMSKDVNLVTDDYYSKEIKYQEQIDRVKRTNNLPEKLKVKVLGENIVFRFPSIFKSDKIEGNILLYRPSNRYYDHSLSIELNKNNEQSFSSENLLKGLWKIKVDWTVDSLTYFNEENIMVN
ncbi:fixH [bacterium BMS3Abin04]|nr:fixH [bacterium BMS3Abin04]